MGPCAKVFFCQGIGTAKIVQSKFPTNNFFKKTTKLREVGIKTATASERNFFSSEFRSSPALGVDQVSVDKHS